MKTILVTGPIGSGKSEACRYLASLGFPVYDCDSRTKLLYSLVPGLKCRIEDALELRWEQIGRTRHYSPVIAREDARREETASFLDRVYGGRLGLMMSALVDDHALTKEDIDELSEILRKAGEGK